MSRPKLTSLAALMPQKGTAAQPEHVIERASEQDSKLAGELESNLEASGFNDQTAVDFSPMTPPAGEHVSGTDLLGKTASRQSRGAVSEQRVSPARETAREHAGEQASGQVTWQERELQREHASKLAGSDDPGEYIDGPRSSVSFRMTERLKDRLRDYAHFSRRQKQDVMDQAVHEFLRRQGY